MREKAKHSRNFYEKSKESSIQQNKDFKGSDQVSDRDNLMIKQQKSNENRREEWKREEAHHLSEEESPMTKSGIIKQQESNSENRNRNDQGLKKEENQISSSHLQILSDNSI